MRTAFRSTAFKRDIKRAEKRGKRMLSLRDVLSLLLEGAALPKKDRDHALTGDWNGYRELHIEPDWLLITASKAKSYNSRALAPTPIYFDKEAGRGGSARVQRVGRGGS